MTGNNTTRRRFLVAAITYSGLFSSGVGLSMLRASSAWAQSSTTDLAAVMGRFARMLYPHDAISDEVYAEVIDGILSAAASDPAMSSALNAAVSALNAAQNADWFDLDEETQLVAMQSVQAEAFFDAIKAQVMGRFYSHAKVWELIEYPGSSIEQGGYLDRGFNDIDWLPEEA